MRAELDTAACQHSQDDGSTEYLLLTLHVEIDGQQRMLRLRTSEALYPGNAAMSAVLCKVVSHINSQETPSCSSTSK